MAISVYDIYDFRSKLIPHFIDGDIEQLDPCFATFKRINRISAQNENYDNLITNLKLIGKAWIRVDYMYISDHVFYKLRKLFRDKEINLMIDTFEIFYSNKYNILNEDIEFINKISLKILRIYRIIRTVENIKMLALINCISIDAFFNNFLWMTNSYLWFRNTPIQLLDSKFYQMLTFEWESIKFFVENDQIEKIILLKTNSDNFLFIPLDIVKCISCSGFREILSADDINKQFADLGFELQFKEDGFVVPMEYSNRIIVNFDDSGLDYLNQFKDINKVFKAKHIKLRIENWDRLLEINKLFPDDFYQINFEYFYYYQKWNQ